MQSIHILTKSGVSKSYPAEPAVLAMGHGLYPHSVCKARSSCTQYSGPGQSPGLEPRGAWHTVNRATMQCTWHVALWQASTLLAPPILEHPCMLDQAHTASLWAGPIQATDQLRTATNPWGLTSLIPPRLNEFFK